MSAMRFRRAIRCELWLLNNHNYIQSDWTCCSINAYNFVVRYGDLYRLKVHIHIFFTIGLPRPYPQEKKTHQRMTCMDFQIWWAFFRVTFGKQMILLFNISFPFNLHYENECIGLYKNDIILFIYML